jgi:alpha-tubulin suppressor-like RCC1 family protein
MSVFCGFALPLFSQTPKYTVANGEYQNFILDNSTQTLYGLGTGGNGIGSNPMVLGYAAPCQFPSPNTKIKFAAGGLHTGTAIDVNGNVFFTGANEDGSMGNGTTTGGATGFVQVTTDSLGNPFNNVTNLVMASTAYTGGAGYGAIIFAIKADGTLWVWGNTQGGYRGNGTYGMVNTRPVQVPFPAGTVITKVAVQNVVIALDSKGNVWTWAGNGGNNCLLGNTSRANYETPQILALPSAAKDIAGGGYWSYALLTNGQLYGWGLYLGYMGVGATASAGWTNQPSPILLDGDLNLPSPIAHISCNATTTYAILADGSMWSWGGNECGQAGTGVELNYAIYTMNPSPYGGTSAAPYAWDWDMSNAQCQQHKPVQIAPGMNNFVALSEGTAAVFYKFAVDASGQLYAWGRNKYGVMGNGVMDANPVNGNIGSIYPNSWDVPYVTALNPIPAPGAQTIQSTSPYCLGNPSTSPCNVYAIPANTAPSTKINGVRGGSETVTGADTSLDGTASTDNVAIVYYIWTQVSGPSTPIISIPSGKKVNIMGLTTGTYVFKLKCIDNGWMKDSTTFTLNVNTSGSTAPVVNAGANQTITLPVNSVTLTGNATDASGTIKGYQWTQVSGPSTAGFGTATQSQTTATGLLAGVYVFKLTVTNNSGLTGTATVQVTVKPAVAGPPAANAGTDQTITLPTNSVTLAGSGSETNGTIASYQWTELSGPTTATITSSSNASTTVTGLVQGVYSFQLTVTDALGVKATDAMKVTVNAAVNGAPIAIAGTDQTITLPTNSVTLAGSGSETNGTIVSYQWTELSGPSTAAITSASLASTGVSGLVQGVYSFQLTVTDALGVKATDAVKITVNPAVAIPGTPAANAGPDQTITLPLNNVTLSGLGSESGGGTIVSYDWMQTSGPSTATITSPLQAGTTVTALVQGVYTFQFTVKDNSGVTASDVMKVTVNAAAPAPVPIAIAGADQTITLPTNSVTLSGSGSESGGTIVSYVWTQTSGASTATITTPAQAQTTVTGLIQGVYTFELTVKDNSGVTANDVMKVTVNAAPVANQPPVANAGPNQTIIAPMTMLYLDGSASYDPDGSIVGYDWVQLSGAGGITITNSSSAVPAIYGLQPGVYVFQLTVTDNLGATATTTVTITVVAPANTPVAVAGNDTTLVYPAAIADLNGSASYEQGGAITGYSWTQLSGPSAAVFADSTAATTTVQQLQTGSYVFQLTVTDSKGDAATSTVTVTVLNTLRTSGKEIMSIYPNPFPGNVVYVNALNDWMGPVKVMIRDASGHLVTSYEFDKETTEFNQMIQMPNRLAVGMYLLILDFHGQRPEVYRLIKQ